MRSADDTANGGIGLSHAIVHINNHLRFLDRIEIGAVNRKDAATGSEAPQRLNLHNSRVLCVAKGPLGEDAPRVVNRHTRCVAAVNQTGQFIKEGGHAAAHIEVETRDREQSAATLRSKRRENVVQFEVLSFPSETNQKKIRSKEKNCKLCREKKTPKNK